MDAKISFRRKLSGLTPTFSPSGLQLFLGLWIGLSIFASVLDWFSGRLLWNSVSLTLPFWLCGLLTAAIGYWAVPALQALKTGQIIREDGPQAHLKKAGTPTMGGIFFLPVAVAIALLWTRFAPGVADADFASVLAVALLTLTYAAIGWIDDWQVLRRKSNKGISPRMKLVLQIASGGLFCLWLAWNYSSSLTTVALPLGLSLGLGLLFWPLAWFVLVAESNATNLTDGLDGLAGGTCAIALLGLGAFVSSTSPGLMVFCACLSGGCLGFLVHNRNPAQVFMGDTGSLALGAALAGVALVTNTLWILLILGGLFFVESLSVIAQVSYYKATKGPDGIGKRLFRMAPIHHHLELSGWSETQVVGAFYGLTALLGLVCLILR